MKIEFSLVYAGELGPDGRPKISRINLVLDAENSREKKQLEHLATRAHEAQLTALMDGKAGGGSPVGTSSSGTGTDSMVIEVHLGGPNLSEVREKIRDLLTEAIRLNDTDV